jgi:hypothetical protein
MKLKKAIRHWLLGKIERSFFEKGKVLNNALIIFSILQHNSQEHKTNTPILLKKRNFSSLALTAFLLVISDLSGFGQSQTFTYTGSVQTFTVPSGVTSVTVDCWGGGGRGGSAIQNGQSQAGGGAGGGAYSRKVITVTSGNNYDVYVGGGGNSDANLNGANSYFEAITTIIARGGTGVATNNLTGGSGGVWNAADGDFGYSGGTGANGVAGSRGGGGGSSAGTGLNGTNGVNAAGGIAPSGGGNGGNGSTSNGNPGVGGVVPGGGGGGATKGNGNAAPVGGNGANGRVRITYTCPTYSLIATSATNACTSTGTSTVTLTSSAPNLPTGTYTVTYNRSNPAAGGTGLTASMTVSTAGTGTFIATGLATVGSSIITVTNLGSGAGNGVDPLCSSTISTNNTATITVSNTPAQPSTITGNTTPCQGSSQTYSVTNVSGVTYTWILPSGWSGTSTTNSITATVGSNSGTISVTPSIGSCSGTAQTLLVTVSTSVPSQPSTINGSTNPDQGSSQNYSVTNVAGVTYTWSFPAGWTQTGGGTTNSVTVTVGATSGNVQVTPSNSCGNGTARTLAVTVNPVVTYCAAGSTTCDEFIGRVEVGSIDNNSVCSAGGYANYTALSTNMTIGTGYAISVTNGTPYFGDQCGIWADWNKDGDFIDANETITVSGGPGSFTATITPPAGATVGTTRLRIRVMWTGAVSSCGTADWGEVEDYTINVQPNIAVSASVSTSSVNENSGTSMVYTFTRTGSTASALTINFSVGGTAGYSSDYSQSNATTFNSTAGTATFAASSSTTTVTITPIGDTSYENDETVILTVTTGSGYSVGSPAAATATIENDDSLPDTDSDGVPDLTDLDDDNDGITDCAEKGLDGTTVNNAFVLTDNAAAVSATEIRLTEEAGYRRGTAMYKNRISFSESFGISFQTFLGDNDGADGIAIVFHNSPAGVNAIGANGEGMGASGIANGIVLEMDTYYNNAQGDPTGDHGCIWESDNIANRISAPITVGELENNNWHNVTVSWNAATTTISYTVNGINAGSYTGDIINNFFAGSSSVYFGFSAATGGSTNVHSIRFNGDLCELPAIIDTDSDGIPDYQDVDSDGDGCFDVLEAGYAGTTQGRLVGSGVNLVNGLVTGYVAGYSAPSNGNGNGIFDFQEDIVPVITVQPPSKTACENGTTSLIVETTNANTFQWQVSTDGGNNFANLSDIGIYSGTSNDTLTLTGVDLIYSTYQYQVLVSSLANVCILLTSSPATLTVIPEIENNIVSSAQTICSGVTPQALTGTFPAGGTGSYTYLWEQSTTDAVSGFSVAPGTNNSQNYSPGSLTTTTWYRRTITSGVCSNPSVAIEITVSANPTPVVTITANPSTPICYGTEVTFTASHVAGGTPNYQWYLNGGAVGSNSNTYLNATLNNDDIISCLMTSSLSCASPSTDTSDPITMVVISAPTANAGNFLSTCSNTGAVNITDGASASNYSSVEWTSSGSGGFTDASSLTLCEYTPSVMSIYNCRI